MPTTPRERTPRGRGVLAGRVSGATAPHPRNYQLTRFVTRAPTVLGFGLLPLPLRWLQRLQMVRPLSGSLVPPTAMAMMWSGSALCGCLPRS